MTEYASPTRPTRYLDVSEGKSTGATYTPPELADFVALEMLREWNDVSNHPLRILDPAVGEGELLASLLKLLPKDRAIEVYGYDSNQSALDAAELRLSNIHRKAEIKLFLGNFLEIACEEGPAGPLFDEQNDLSNSFDMIIANPPYVRTQIMGSAAARDLAGLYGLTGRVDLYHAFIHAIAKVLHPTGVAGIIVSNRFMTTKAGATVRRIFQEQLNLRQIWDLGDTKIFDAAVLPAVIIAEGLKGKINNRPSFVSIYETKDEADCNSLSVTDAFSKSGVINVPDGRKFRVQRGALDTSGTVEGVWRVATDESDAWLAVVFKHTWGTFRDIGKVRVGVKTCADRVFIQNDWDSLPPEQQPELLRVLTTHHVGRRFRADMSLGSRQIIYPHEIVDGKRCAVDLNKTPNTRRYLETHRKTLEGRSYVIEAGRNWYELWVPQDPNAWSRMKLVFRDISEHPCFWIDRDKTIVNGDCYWIMAEDAAQEDLLWLAVSVGNSSFIEKFYDQQFNNKLYAGRRRYITQYVEKFPLPNPKAPGSLAIINMAKNYYEKLGAESCSEIERELDILVWNAFGLSFEEINR